ncbi:MAG: copper chaperone PCu(A)C [Magnetovibrio sp.]|nr:copper chaperone PCu(A)C [Magnetovibrio sp.]
MKKVLFLIAVLTATTLFSSVEASAAMKLYKVGDIAIENPWARATADRAKNGAAYLTIKNNGSTMDRLMAIQSPIAKIASAHQSLMQDGMMKMKPIKSLNVLAGGTVLFKPGSYHIMFMGLKEPLKKGASFPLNLVFEHAGKITVMVPVLKIGSMGNMHKMKPKL